MTRKMIVRANEIIRDCRLKDTKGNVLNWRKLDNGSKIMVRGLSNTKDPDQIRGNKAKVIVIDEFFHLKNRVHRLLFNIPWSCSVSCYSRTNALYLERVVDNGPGIVTQ